VARSKAPTFQLIVSQCRSCPHSPGLLPLPSRIVWFRPAVPTPSGLAAAIGPRESNLWKACCQPGPSVAFRTRMTTPKAALLIGCMTVALQLPAVGAPSDAFASGPGGQRSSRSGQDTSSPIGPGRPRQRQAPRPRPRNPLQPRSPRRAFTGQRLGETPEMQQVRGRGSRGRSFLRRALGRTGRWLFYAALLGGAAYLFMTF
jgi:hypothetical protein